MAAAAVAAAGVAGVLAAAVEVAAEARQLIHQNNLRPEDNQENDGEHNLLCYRQ